MNFDLFVWHLRCAWVDVKKGFRALVGRPFQPTPLPKN
jgi:hypothetical protein